jgi:hypothetical protein
MANTKDKLVEIDYEKLKDRPKTRTQAENFVSTYSNAMNVEVTFTDFKLFFGEIVEATHDKLVTVDRVAVLITPEQARLIAKVLTKQIEQYESRFGPIRKPPVEEE